MGIFDRSKSVTEIKEENYQQILTENRAISEVSGLNVAEVGGNVEIAIDQVDSGVVAAARDLGSGAISVAGDIAASAMRAQERAVGEVGDVSRESIFAARGIAGDSIRAQNDITEYALQSTRATVETVTGRALATLNEAVTGAANATRSDTSELLGTVVKYGAIIAAVLGGVYIFTRARA